MRRHCHNCHASLGMWEMKCPCCHGSAKCWLHLAAGAFSLMAFFYLLVMVGN